MADCFTRIKEHVTKSGLEIPAERLKEFSQQLEKIRAESMTPDQFDAAARQLIEEDMTRFLAKKRAADAIVLAARERAVRLIKDRSFGASAAENMRSWLEGGSLKRGDSVNLDVRKIQHAVEADIRKTFRRGMEPYKDLAAHGALDREIYQELWAIQKGEAPGASGSKIAAEIAKVIHATQNQIFDLKKAHNPFIEKADEYLIKQSHSREKVSQVSAMEWVADAMKTYGKRSFPDLTMDEKVQVFRSIYERIKDGSYGSVVDDSVSDKFITVNGTGGNIMRRMARSRVLVAEDWQAQYEYSLKYGIGTIADTMDQVIRRSAKDIAILSKFGPNPQGMYEGVYRRVLSTLSGEEREAFEAKKGAFDTSFRAATGVQDAPARGQVAKIVQGALTLEYLAKTGGAWMSSLPDIAIAAGMVRGLNGRTVFQNAAEIVAEYGKAFASTADRNEALEGLWMFSRTANYELMNALGSPKAGPGALGKMAELHGKLTLLNRHENSMRAAVGVVVSRQMAGVAHLEHAQLPARWQQGLLRYGIGELEWNTLRRGVEDWGIREDGERISGKLLNADGVEQLPDELIENYLRKSGQLEGKATSEAIYLGRKQLAFKLGALINDHADYSSSRPGTRQTAFLYQGTDINDPKGQLLRLIAQFKSAAVTAADSYRRMYFSGEGPRGDWSGVAQKVVLGVFLWTLGKYAKDAAAGKTPEDPTQPDFVVKALVSSGVAGVFGDILVAEADREGVKDMMLGALKSAAGPVLGDAAEASAVAIQYGKSAAGSGKAPNSQAARLAMSLVPGQNLLWSKAALNYYFTYGLREFLNPGYLSALEGNVNQTPGLLEERQRYFFLRPSEAPRW